MSKLAFSDTELLKGGCGVGAAGFLKSSVHYVNLLTPKEGYSVGFFHRTVVEFLQTDVVWEKLGLRIFNTPFDPEMALMSSCVSELKAMPIKDRDETAVKYALERVNNLRESVGQGFVQHHTAYILF
ncbi:hypothetical protein QBC36DRAFT_357158 [Triangularia setosa]|uniref:DUF7791 domain-containing protein n=1 Tax=Triangularia setosa TaxID=2587417 RepID=A0AAN6W6I7_9PEZI|nr:hypothetical protein QBC36DRAFT_357158 [Podospora setosa]